MKHVIFFSTITLLLFLVIGCLKEDVYSKKTNEITPTIVLSNTDFEGMSTLRNGYHPFHSPFTLVDFDIFQPAKLTVNNLVKLDSVEYNRISTDVNKYLGVIFNPFLVTYYFNGYDTTVTRLVPSYILDHEVRYPNIDYNQLDYNNPNEWIVLEKMTKKDKPYHVRCGKLVNRFWYKFRANSGYQTELQHEGDCDGSLPYKLIF